MELLRALGSLSEAPAPEHEAIAAALGLPPLPDREEWTRLFVLELPPYASIYLGGEGMIGGEARARVAGFWRAVGLVPPAEPDHLASLLGLAAALAEAESAEPDVARRALRRRVRAALHQEHLASWLPLYLGALESLAGEFSRAWAQRLGEALAEQAAQLRHPDWLSAHLREAAGLSGDDRDLDSLVAELLVPVRTGLVLTPSRLRRAARELGLGLRLGERRPALRALLAQDPAATLAWLAREAEAAAAHPGAPWAGEACGTFWRERATAAGAQLSRLAEAARTLEVSHAG